jgi:hypothetical protein
MSRVFIGVSSVVRNERNNDGMGERDERDGD